jgi:hypothetical protein
MMDVSLRLIKFVILVQHDCNCKIDQEERANNDTCHKIYCSDKGLVSIHHHVHYLRPTFKSDALEDCQESVDKVIKVGDSKVNFISS